ncbi:hypothetical protein ABFS83_13G190100 [Erythranthe nasuta]
MTHIALPWWHKTSSSTTNCSCRGSGSGPTTTTTTSNNSTRTEAAASNNCCGLSKLIRRIKKRTKMLQYDPLSYSLNFDTTASGDFTDEDYYKYYAFSSRFVATPTIDCQRSVLVAPSH